MQQITANAETLVHGAFMRLFLLLCVKRMHTIFWLWTLFLPTISIFIVQQQEIETVAVWFCAHVCMPFLYRKHCHSQWEILWYAETPWDWWINAWPLFPSSQCDYLLLNKLESASFMLLLLLFLLCTQHEQLVYRLSLTQLNGKIHLASFVCDWDCETSNKSNPRSQRNSLRLFHFKLRIIYVCNLYMFSAKCNEETTNFLSDFAF